jgi:branched-chain amino acid transport system substrate-binding protein
VGSQAGGLLQTAIEKAGTTETTAVRDALKGLTIETLGGPVRFDDSGRNVEARMVLGQIQQGTYVPIYPPEAAGASPVFPKPAW